jgi:Lecithin retinol acyltransferase
MWPHWSRVSCGRKIAMMFRLVRELKCEATVAPAIKTLLRIAVASRQARWFRCFVRSEEYTHATDFQRALPHWQDSILARSEEPAVGAHLVTRRLCYVHHGIYLGGGRVIHCGAVSCFLPRGPVEEVSLRDFRRGRAIAVRGGVPKYSAWEIVDRARSRLGENRYRLLTNNCEHFCEWCVRGERRSYQVERLMRWLPALRALGAIGKSNLGESLGDGFEDDGGKSRGGRRQRAAAVV